MMRRSQDAQLARAPLSDDKVEAWWSFRDDYLDDRELKIEEDPAHLQWSPAPHPDDERSPAHTEEEIREEEIRNREYRRGD